MVGGTVPQIKTVFYVLVYRKTALRGGTVNRIISK